MVMVVQCNSDNVGKRGNVGNNGNSGNAVLMTRTEKFSDILFSFTNLMNFP